MPAFSGSRLKLQRARRHIEELRAEAGSWLQNDPIAHTETSKVAVGTGTLIESTTIPKPLPVMLPAIIGDIVHNIRAALDLMACELATAHGGDPTKTSFPFSKTEEGLAKEIKNKGFDQCGREAVELLVACQPFIGGNIELRAIHDLDIIDKHRQLMPEPCTSFNLFDFRFVERPDGSRGVDVIPTAAPEMNLSLVMPAGTGLDGRPLFETMEALAALAEATIDEFDTLLPGQ